MLNSKKSKLIAGIAFDLIGMATPFLLDLAWAPISGYLMKKMYGGQMGKTASYLVTIEELIPGLDFIPSFTLMWLYTYVYQGSKKAQEITVEPLQTA